jgi:hypothetical protein
MHFGSFASCTLNRIPRLNRQWDETLHVMLIQCMFLSAEFVEFTLEVEYVIFSEIVSKRLKTGQLALRTIGGGPSNCGRRTIRGEDGGVANALEEVLRNASQSFCDREIPLFNIGCLLFLIFVLLLFFDVLDICVAVVL